MKKIFPPAGAVLSALLLALVFSSCLQQYDPRDTKPAEDTSSSVGGIPLESLKGTVWIWDSPWGRRWLRFDPSDMTVEYTGQEGDQWIEKYTYDSAGKKGVMDYYGESGFEVSADNETMHFIEWKKYGHGSDYERHHEN
jgi:hypothetical protein